MPRGGPNRGQGKKRSLHPGKPCPCAQCKGAPQSRSTIFRHKARGTFALPPEPEVVYEHLESDPEDRDLGREHLNGVQPAANDHEAGPSNRGPHAATNDDDEDARYNRRVNALRCEVCASPDELHFVMCDGCDKGWHLYCLRPALLAFPRGEWYCSDCAAQRGAAAPPAAGWQPQDWVPMPEDERERQDDEIKAKMEEMKTTLLRDAGGMDNYDALMFLIEQQLAVVRLYARGKMTQDTLEEVMHIMNGLLQHFGARSPEDMASEPKDWQSFKWRYRHFHDHAEHRRICDCGQHVFPVHRGGRKKPSTQVCPECHGRERDMKKPWIWMELDPVDAIRAMYMDMNIASMMRAHDLYFSTLSEQPPGPDSNDPWVVEASWGSPNHRDRRAECPAFFAEPRNVMIIACADGASTTRTEKRRYVHRSFAGIPPVVQSVCSSFEAVNWSKTTHKRVLGCEESYGETSSSFLPSMKTI